MNWISVKDKLPPTMMMMPSKGKVKPYVLVTDAQDRMAVAYPIQYSSHVQWVSGKAIGEVVAWMPLPEPYEQAA
jgi:hypothetical protein